MNAKIALSGLIGEVDTRLESMNKFEKVTVDSLERYVAAPTIDDSSAQPDPTGK